MKINFISLSSPLWFPRLLLPMFSTIAGPTPGCCFTGAAAINRWSEQPWSASTQAARFYPLLLQHAATRSHHCSCGRYPPPLQSLTTLSHWRVTL